MKKEKSRLPYEYSLHLLPNIAPLLTAHSIQLLSYVFGATNQKQGILMRTLTSATATYGNQRITRSISPSTCWMDCRAFPIAPALQASNNSVWEAYVKSIHEKTEWNSLVSWALPSWPFVLGRDNVQRLGLGIFFPSFCLPQKLQKFPTTFRYPRLCLHESLSDTTSASALRLLFRCLSKYRLVGPANSK